MKPPDNNIASSLRQNASDIPDTPAIIDPGRKKQVTFLQLHRESERLASGLSSLGIAPGDRVLLMVPFGIEFITLTFALFKTGAVTVLIDPGLGRKNILRCIGESEPAGMVVVPLVHAARKIFPVPFKTLRVAVTAGKRWFWGGTTLEQAKKLGKESFESVFLQAESPAAILFTSGSTGPPKGVLYTHRMFHQQMDILQRHFDIRKGEIDLPTFPLFGLFGAGMGMTSVIPEMDFTRPAKVDPENIIQTVEKYKVTNSFGSPALWDTVTRYCANKNVFLPGLKRILIAGAPVPGKLLRSFETVVDPDCEIFTPYGATEALPVSWIERKKILNETWDKTQQGHGICVGETFPGLELKIIKVTDDPIPDWDSDLDLPHGEPGEIAVRAPWVARVYYNREDDTRLAKIKDGDSFWHRMGDIGRMDDSGSLWFLGRKSQRVITSQGTLYTIPSESVFNRHPDVKKSALVGLGDRGHQQPVMVIEPENPDRVRSKNDQETFRRELLKLGEEIDWTRDIREILFHPEFPVDIRHNAKIFREQLAVWAASQTTPGGQRDAGPSRGRENF